MAGIFTRPALDKIIRNSELTDEQKTDQLFSLYGRALDDGFIAKSAAEEAKQAAVDAAKAEFKVPEPIDVKTTPEYMELQHERDRLRAINGDDFATVKPKFREQVFDMLDRSDKAQPVSEQLNGIKEKYEEFFTATQPEEQPRNTPQYSQQPKNQSVNPQSDEDKLVKQLADAWK